MKPLPQPTTCYHSLHDTMLAPIRCKLLMTALELGVFDRLRTYRSAEAIAEQLGYHPGNTRRLLDALSTIGLVQKQDGLYRNGPVAAEFLVQQGDVYLGPLFRLVEEMCLNSLDDLAERVKSGPFPAAGEADFASAQLWAAATRATAGWVTGGAGGQVAAMLSKLPEFSGWRRMLDLGGGHGIFALYLVAAHSSMTAVVLDRPEVTEVAADFIRQYEMQGRVSVMAGDYLVDPIGDGYDLVWACSTLNFARGRLEALVGKIRDALNPGGCFISFQDGLTDEHTQPAVRLGHLGDAVRTGRDFFFDQGEIADTMLRCGFRSVRSRTVATPMGALDMDIARK